MKPQRPKTLPPLAEKLLVEIARQPLADQIVLGGGIALKHYADFRETHDIDAWWLDSFESEALEHVLEAARRVAHQQGLEVQSRRFGATDSIEFVEPTSGMKVFSFQIASRDLSLETSVESSWPPIKIETLRENIGAKMNALVNRGAPRDFVDIYEVVQRGLISKEECWQLWMRKNPDGEPGQAKRDVVAALERLSQRRPLATIPEPDRSRAAQVREWIVNTLCGGT